VHEKYRPKRNGISPHDIAIIKLYEPITFDRYIRPVPLPNPSDYHSKFCYTLGYGKEKSHRRSTDLRQIKLPMIEPHLCEKISQSKFIRRHQLCAGYLQYQDLSYWLSPKIVSKGDSGGALMCRLKLANGTRGYVLIGLATGGKRPKWFKRADSLYISYFADIKYHLKWIRSHSEISESIVSLHNE
ncbi:Trypsin-like serine protease, partial [Euroglyphus maynei]